MDNAGFTQSRVQVLVDWFGVALQSFASRLNASRSPALDLVREAGARNG